MSSDSKSSSISSSTLQREVGTVLRRVALHQEHLVVERDGFPVAVMLPLSDYRALKQDRERLEAILNTRPSQTKP